MPYQTDQKFSIARDFADFYLLDERFRTRDRFSANSTGQNWNVFRRHSNAEWPLLASAYRLGSLDQFTQQPPPGLPTATIAGVIWEANCTRKPVLYIFFYGER